MFSPAKSCAALALATGLVLVPVAAAKASPDLTQTATYGYKPIKVTGEVQSAIAGMNLSGAYTGVGCNSTCTETKNFVATASGKQTFFTLPFKNYDSSGETSGIDNAGDVVGDYLDSKGSVHGFERLASGKMIEINDPAAANAKGAGTRVNNISFDGSVIVGNYVDSTGVLHGFLLKGGKFTAYNVPKAAGTAVSFYNYNEYGGVYFSSTDGYFGFYVDSQGKLHTVAAPGESKPSPGHGTVLIGINSDRTLFGNVYSPIKPTTGFADTAGSFTSINDPKEVGNTPLDGTSVDNVSPVGNLVGEYTYTLGTAKQGGLIYGFIATPASPST
jgi:hypothetical protein